MFLNKAIDSYLKPGVRVHLVGIGGVSMRPLGLVLKGMGVIVTGSDMNASASTRELEDAGIPVAIGHRAENIEGAACVIRTAAAMGVRTVILCGACADICHCFCSSILIQPIQ